MGRVQLQVNSKFNGLVTVTKDVAVTSRTWVRNDTGTATIVVPTSHPRLYDIIQWGNILRLREYGVPTWIGQAVSREWGYGTITLQCKSAEWMLQKKLTGQGRVYGAGGAVPAGQVAADLFYNAAVQNNDIRVLHGGAFTLSRRVFKEYNYADLYESFRKLAEETGGDFWVDENLVVHFCDNRGTDKRGSTVLREGRHLSEVRIVESADDVLTAAIGLGEGDKVVDRAKLLLKLPDQPFFRAEVVDVNGATSPEMLNDPVRTELSTRGMPRIAVDANIQRINGTYGDFWVGDLITLVVKHPIYRQLGVKVIGLELGDNETMRGIFEVIPSPGVEPAPWGII